MLDKSPCPEEGEPAQKPDSTRWCWECRRRRLVCDCTRPVCNKCRATGVVCPGYEDAKPLKWLAPGKVLSRSRKPRNRRGSQRTTGKKTQEPVSSTTDSDTSSSQDVAPYRRGASPFPAARLRTDMCDLAEAAVYCKTGPLWA